MKTYGTNQAHRLFAFFLFLTDTTYERSAGPGTGRRWMGRSTGYEVMSKCWLTFGSRIKAWLRYREQSLVIIAFPALMPAPLQSHSLLFPWQELQACIHGMSYPMWARASTMLGVALPAVQAVKGDAGGEQAELTWGCKGSTRHLSQGAVLRDVAQNTTPNTPSPCRALGQSKASTPAPSFFVQRECDSHQSPDAAQKSRVARKGSIVY